MKGIAYRFLRVVSTTAFILTSMSSIRKTMALADIQKHALERIIPCELPQWARHQFRNEPKERMPLANLPTPFYRLHSNGSKESIIDRLEQKGISFYIKRDDMSGGVELGGNKVRKLEFLLADALRQGCDSVVTIGGEQSNHCRATAAAARQVGMAPHLILRTKRAQAVHEGKEDFGFRGNILFDRIVGSTIYTCTPGEYGRLGSKTIVKRVCEYLQSSEGGNCKPYPIPVGGSNGLGSFGYLLGVDELVSQWKAMHKDSNASIDHICFACGSGGTAAGIALGIALVYGALENSSKPSGVPIVHAIGVCDDPDYFYEFVAGIADEMGLILPEELGMTTEQFIREHLKCHQGKGLGYALSTEEELDFVCQFGIETGIGLDPVYSGKALYNFVNFVMEDGNAASFEGTNVVFWHTGGALGLYEQGGRLISKLNTQAPVKRLDVYGKDMEGGSVDISK